MGSESAPQAGPGGARPPNGFLEHFKHYSRRERIEKQIEKQISNCILIYNRTYRVLHNKVRANLRCEKTIGGISPSWLQVEAVCLIRPLVVGPGPARTSRPRLRSADTTNYVQPRIRTKFAKRAFSRASLAAWNSIPDKLRQTPTFNGFKRNHKTHLLALRLGFS